MARGLVVCFGGCFTEQVTRCLVDGGRAEQQGWLRELKITDSLLQAARLHQRGWWLLWR
jgi:hypothetical protein